MTIPTGIAELWNSGSSFDPHGDETLANLSGAINGAVQTAERARKADAARALVVAKEPDPWKAATAFGLAALKTFAVLDADMRQRQANDGAAPKPRSMAAIKRGKVARETEEWTAYAARSVPWEVRKHWLHPDEYGGPPMHLYEKWSGILGEPEWHDDANDEGDGTVSEEPEGPRSEFETEDTPAPAPTLRQIIKKEVTKAMTSPPAPRAPIAKPNGNAAPAAIEAAEGWPLGIKWGLAALVLAAGVLGAVRFPLKLE